MKFKTQFNADQFPHVGKKNSGVSQTMPGMALSIRELMSRIARGIPVSQVAKEFDEIDPDDEYYVIPDFDKMELPEKEAFLRQAKEHVDNVRSQLNEKARLMRIDAEKAAIKKQRDQWEAEHAESLKSDSRVPKAPQEGKGEVGNNKS